VRLPWGSDITVDPAEDIGRNVLSLGLYELEVCEAIFRLLDKGERGVDVGANIGIMTSAMARAAGPHGNVTAFEPSSRVFRALEANRDLWDRHKHAAVEINSTALSSHAGTAVLFVPRTTSNRGLSTLSMRDGLPPSDTANVNLARLDEVVLDKSPKIALMKIDVEGHESEVLAGSARLLERRAIRDIIFEDWHSFPSASHALLSENGYTIFRLSRDFWRPALLPPETPPNTSMASSFLATAEPDRARERFATRGWKSLRK